MPKAKYVYYAVPDHPGVQYCEHLDRYRVRWTKKGQEKVAYFDSLPEAERFRTERGLGRSGAWARDPAKRGRLLANLRQVPLQHGKQHRVVHGGQARVPESELAQRVETIYEVLAEDAPVRVNGELPRHDKIVVRKLAEALIRRERITAYEHEHDLVTDTGKVRGATELGMKLDAQIIELCRELGMTPRSRSSLGLELAMTAATVHGLEFLGGKNPIDLPGPDRRAAARALLAAAEQDEQELPDVELVTD